MERARQHTSTLLVEVRAAKDQAADAHSDVLGLNTRLSLLILQRDEARFAQERTMEEATTFRRNLSDDMRALLLQEQKTRDLLLRMQQQVCRQKEVVCREEQRQKRGEALKDGLVLLSDQVYLCHCQCKTMDESILIIQCF